MACTCLYKPGKSKPDLICSSCHMRQIRTRWSMDQLNRLQALPVENLTTLKFLWWPRRDPKTGRRRFGHVTLIEQTYVHLAEVSWGCPSHLALWVRDWRVVEIRPRGRKESK